MLNEKWDLLVIGAGPAGSCAAKAAAEQGLRVLLVERRTTVGVPVQCAEYIPALLLGQTGLNRDVVIQATSEMHTHIPGGEVNTLAAPGFIVARNRFDQALADQAQVAGAKLLCATSAVDFDPSSRRVLLKCADGHRQWISPTVIIGADGPHSRVRRWAGLDRGSLMPAVQVRLRLTRPLDHTEVYFDQRIFGGYGWLFPRGRYANVGLGIVRRRHQQMPINGLLRQFTERLIQAGKVTGAPVQSTCGWLPVAPLTTTVNGNMMLAGDAAGQTHPITGAGIFSAVTCGALAGNQAAEALNQADLSLLGGYEVIWRDLLGATLGRAHERRKILESQWSRLDEIVKYCWVAFKEYYAGLEPKK